ncbi:MAG: YIP1 family protein [Dehalococcoidia bacterium]
MDPNKTINYIMRLARLDTSVFDEVKDDTQELIPAIIVVVVSALIAGLGVWLWLMLDAPGGYDVDFANVFINVWLLGTLFTVGLWVAWVAIVYVVLVQFYKETADFQTLLRTMGYAAFPFSLSLLLLIPSLGFGFALTAIVLWFVMSTYAIHATTTAASDRVMIANAAGFLVFAVMMGLLATETGMTTGAFSYIGDAVFEGEYFDFGGGFDIDDL